MYLARVTGRLWASVKNDPLEGKRMLVVQPLNAKLQPAGKQLVALDAIGAGTGDVVYYCKGKEASFPWLPEEVPTEATVLGIVDHVDTD